MALANIFVVLRMERFADFQTVLFRVSMLTGWVLLAALVIGFSVEPASTLPLIDAPVSHLENEVVKVLEPT